MRQSNYHQCLDTIQKKLQNFLISPSVCYVSPAKHRAVREPHASVSTFPPQILNWGEQPAFNCCTMDRNVLCYKQWQQTSNTTQ